MMDAIRRGMERDEAVKGWLRRHEVELMTSAVFFLFILCVYMTLASDQKYNYTIIHSGVRDDVVSYSRINGNCIRLDNDTTVCGSYAIIDLKKTGVK